MLTIQKISFLFLLMTFTIACDRDNRKFIVECDPFLDSPVFDKSYLSHIYEKKDSARFDWNKYHVGDTIFREIGSKIIATNFPNINYEETYDYLGIQAYKSNDTVFLILQKDMGSINFIIHDAQYTASEFIYGPGQFKNKQGSIIVPVNRSRLIFKTKGFNVDDRIYGFLFIETDEFFKQGVTNINFYRGAFTTVILSKEEFEKYHIPRIFI
jgi:hypothetical protein